MFLEVFSYVKMRGCVSTFMDSDGANLNPNIATDSSQKDIAA